MHGVARGKIAAGLAATGVALAVLAVLLGVVFAIAGAYLLIVAPVVGLPVAFAVYRALHRRCTTGSTRAAAAASAGILFLGAFAIVGISVGGLPLLLPAVFLAFAAALTPRPASRRLP
jgi:hypothetical protein